MTANHLNTSGVDSPAPPAPPSRVDEATRRASNAPPPPRAAPHPPQAAEPPCPRSGPRSGADLLASLGRRFRGATLVLEIDLRTAMARQVFHRDFVYVSRQLHALEASRRVHGLDRQVMRQALDRISDNANEARALLDAIRRDLHDTVATAQLAAADIAFARPQRLQAIIVSPHARTFVELIAQADDTLTELEKAWLLGVIEPATKTRQSHECRRVLGAFKEVVRRQRHVVGLHVRAVNDARRRVIEPPGGDPHDDESRGGGQVTGATAGIGARQAIPIDGAPLGCAPSTASSES